jgi:hypothetical protein
MPSQSPVRTEPPVANYDEAAVAAHVLPDPLLDLDEASAGSRDRWWTARRAEIVHLFEELVFGAAPGRPTVRTVAIAEQSGALSGLATRCELTVEIAPGAPKLNILLYVPAASSGKAPLVLGPNFLGNHTISHDPGVMVADIDLAGMDIRLPDTPTGEASRGAHADRWSVERILRRGYGLATFYYGDLFPDRADGAKQSIQPFVSSGRTFGWGALATWAWSMSLALDCLQSVPEIDPRRVVVFGHSRHGKAALWAGALDPRFAIVIANNSGKGGASLMRRNFGETIGHLVTRFPHWFAALYKRYAGAEERLPVDQHMLLALIAPRPLYIASAADDLWADPKGEFLSALAADPVYRLLGTNGLPVKQQPAVNHPVMGTIGYHIRNGGHGVTAWDWDRFLDFADRHFGR